jgi:hypothetical protein
MKRGSTLGSQLSLDEGFTNLWVFGRSQDGQCGECVVVIEHNARGRVMGTSGA